MSIINTNYLFNYLLRFRNRIQVIFLIIILTGCEETNSSKIYKELQKFTDLFSIYAYLQAEYYQGKEGEFSRKDQVLKDIRQAIYHLEKIKEINDKKITGSFEISLRKKALKHNNFILKYILMAITPSKYDTDINIFDFHLAYAILHMDGYYRYKAFPYPTNISIEMIEKILPEIEITPGVNDKVINERIKELKKAPST